MNQIKCPNCGEVFTIDESDYAYIVDQIRNHEFENELRKREAALEEKLNMQLQVLKTQYENEKNVLREQIKSKDTEKLLAVNEAVSQIKENKELEVSSMRQKLELLKVESDAKVETLRNTYEEKLSSKDRELTEKQAQVDFYKDLKTKMSTKMIGET